MKTAPLIPAGAHLTKTHRIADDGSWFTVFGFTYANGRRGPITVSSLDNPGDEQAARDWMAQHTAKKGVELLWLS